VKTRCHCQADWNIYHCTTINNVQLTVCRGRSRLIRTSGGVVVGLTIQPVQAWKKWHYKLFDWFIDWSKPNETRHYLFHNLTGPNRIQIMLDYQQTVTTWGTCHVWYEMTLCMQNINLTEQNNKTLATNWSDGEYTFCLVHLKRLNLYFKPKFSNLKFLLFYV